MELASGVEAALPRDAEVVGCTVCGVAATVAVGEGCVAPEKVTDCAWGALGAMTTDWALGRLGAITTVCEASVSVEECGMGGGVWVGTGGGTGEGGTDIPAGVSEGIGVSVGVKVGGGEAGTANVGTGIGVACSTAEDCFKGRSTHTPLRGESDR